MGLKIKVHPANDLAILPSSNPPVAVATYFTTDTQISTFFEDGTSSAVTN